MQSISGESCELSTMAQNGGYEDISENAGMAEESFTNGYQQSGGFRTQR